MDTGTEFHNIWAESFRPANLCLNIYRYQFRWYRYRYLFSSLMKEGPAILVLRIDLSSVAEPVERQHFAGAGAEVYWLGSGSGYVTKFI
jgi:hypothetical protein